MDFSFFVSFEKVVKKSPKNPELWYTLGKIRMQPEIKGDGRKETKKAYRLNPREIKYAQGYAESLKSDKEIKSHLKFRKLAEGN